MITVPENSAASPLRLNIESLTKWTATVLVAVYAGGFLTTSVYYGTFGFHDLNPLKPSVIAAGVWFFLIVGWAVYTACISDRFRVYAATNISGWAERLAFSIGCYSFR